MNEEISEKKPEGRDTWKNSENRSEKNLKEFRHKSMKECWKKPRKKYVTESLNKAWEESLKETREKLMKKFQKVSMKESWEPFRKESLKKA